MLPHEFLEMAKSSRLLDDLDSRVLRSLVPLAIDKRYQAGDVIFREGDRSTFLHLIVSGSVALEMATGPDSLVVQTLHAGDAMGWSALTDEGRTHFEAIALTAVSTIAFRSNELIEVCDREPLVGYALMKRLLEVATERLDAARIKLVHMREPERAKAATATETTASNRKTQ